MTQQEKKGGKVGSGHVVMDKAGGVKAISDAVPAKAMFNDEDSDEEEPDNTMNAAQQHVADSPALTTRALLLHPISGQSLQCPRCPW